MPLASDSRYPQSILTSRLGVMLSPIDLSGTATSRVKPMKASLLCGVWRVYRVKYVFWLGFGSRFGFRLEDARGLADCLESRKCDGSHWEGI